MQESAIPDTTHDRQQLLDLFQEESFHGILDFCGSRIETGEATYFHFGARGRAYFELDEYQKAIDDLSRALELQPDYAKGWYNRGRCYHDVEKYALAIVDLQKAKSITDDLDAVDFYLGACFSGLENYEEAIRCFTAYLQECDDAFALNWRADLYIKIGQFQKANDDLIAALLLESERIEDFGAINSIDKQTSTDHAALENRPLSLGEYGFRLLEKAERGSGIYILALSHSEYYVGQAKKIHQRIAQHRKNLNDIEAIYFKRVAVDDLLKDENATIALLERHRMRIRNLKQVDFQSIFDLASQERWLDDPKFNKIDGSKFDNKEIRQKFADRFLELREKPYFDRLTVLLSKFLRLVIPNYIASEYNYWNITCLPKYLKKSKCITRININAVPVLSVFEGEDRSLSIMIYASKLPFLRFVKEGNSLLPLFEACPTMKLDLDSAFEEQTEGDEITLMLDEISFEQAIENELLLSAIRMLALRMMNKTGKEDKFRRSVSHCLDLADAIIGLVPANEP